MGVLEVHDEVTDGLGHPHRGRMCCGAEDADPALRMPDHHEHVHADTGERDRFEEVTAQQDLSLGTKELGPGARRAFGHRIDAGVGEDLPHGRGGDFDAQDEKFAVDAAVAPVRVLLREAQNQDPDGPEN